MPRANNKKNNRRKHTPLPPNGIASRTRCQKNNDIKAATLIAMRHAIATRRLPIDVIASGTRHQENDIAAALDIPIPIIIEIISWIDQESLINLSLVSKQMHDIIRDEPGNKNKIISVFEIRGSSRLNLIPNLRGYFLNEKTTKRLQSYHIMTFKDLHKLNSVFLAQSLTFVGSDDFHMNGITSLNFTSPSQTLFGLPSTIMKMLPKLREVDLSGTIVNNHILHELSNNCPLLEKVVTSSHNRYAKINLSTLTMSDSRYLKEIHMNNVFVIIDLRDGKKMADLNNHREIFIFHHCCKALERVSILNMKFGLQHPYLSTFIQNVLIKFVRNVPSLRWFRSDLTSENMTMLRMERPEIEFLN